MAQPSASIPTDPVITQPTAPHFGPALVELAATKNGRAPGKAHKSTKGAVHRSYISPAIRASFGKRRASEQRREAIKGVEKQMHEVKEAEAERCDCLVIKRGACGLMRGLVQEADCFEGETGKEG